MTHIESYFVRSRHALDRRRLNVLRSTHREPKRGGIFRDARTGRFLYEVRVENRVESLVFSAADRHLLVSHRGPFNPENPQVFIHRWTMTPFLDELNKI